MTSFPLGPRGADGKRADNGITVVVGSIPAGGNYFLNIFKIFKK